MLGFLMRRIVPLFGVSLLAVLLIAGCGGNDSDDFVDTAYIYARAINGTTDSPSQSFLIGPLRFVSDLPYGTVSPFSGFTSFDTSMEIQGRLADRSLFDLDVIDGLNFQTGYEYTFVTSGFVDDMQSFVVTKPRVRRPFTQIYMQIAHASATEGALEIYLTAPGEDLEGATPYATLGPAEFTASQEIPEGEYQIRVVRPSDGQVLFDTDVLQFFRDPNAPEDRGGRDWFFCVIDAAPSIQWPLQAVLTDGLSVFNIVGAGPSSALRARHVARTLETVDVLIDGDSANPLASNLDYLQSSPHRALAPDEHPVTITAPGQPSNVLLERTVATTPGDETALYLIDSEDAPGSIPQKEDRRSVITEGRLAGVLAAPENQQVSVYIGYPEDVDVENGRYGGLLVNRIVPPGTFSRLSRLPGASLITVTVWRNTDDGDPSNDVEEIAVGPVEIDLSEGDVRTVLIVPPSQGSSAEAEAIVLDDL